MTLNLAWSDRDASYLLADSASTGFATPPFPISLLGQMQKLPEANCSVLEGAQKIIRIGPAVALALCGNERDLLGLAEALSTGISLDHPESIVDYFKSLPAHADLQVTIGGAGLEPAFLLLASPPKRLGLVPRGSVHMTGSLGEGPSTFLLSAMKQVFRLADETESSPKDRLVAGLACATAMAVHFNLTADNVGGAFFGGLLNRAGFSWQPDITYFFYDPKFGLDLQQSTWGEALTLSMVSGAQLRLHIISCRVRDDVSVAVSTIGERSVGAWSRIMTKDVDAWLEKWGSTCAAYQFGDVEYCALIPTVPGMIAVVPIGGSDLALRGTRLVLSEALIQDLHSHPHDGRFTLRVYGK